MRRGAIILLVASAIVAMLAACEPPPPAAILTESKSPDGKWIADAVTVQDSGAGQFGFHTTVYLKSLTDPKTQAPVLVFPNEISKEKGKIELHFRWFDGTLEVLVSRMPTFETQVTRYAGMNITVSQYFEKPIPLSAKQLEEVFHSSDLKNARRLLADFHCNPQALGQVAAVRQAWHELGGTLNTEVTQDHHIQAVMAKCLIEGQTQNAAPDPDIDSAVALLRSAVHSDNIIEALVAGEGLIHYADPRDNQSIVDITHREPKVVVFLTFALRNSCSPNAARTLQLMLEQAPDSATKDKIDAKMKLTEPQHREKCEAPANGKQIDRQLQ
jgi:hypothetical protein